MSLEEFKELGIERVRAVSERCPPGSFDLDLMSLEAFWLTCRSLVHHCDSLDLVGEFLNLPCNKIYVQGGNNAESELLTRLPSHLVAMIPRCGHFLMLENAETLAREIVKVMDQSGSPQMCSKNH